MRYRRNTKRYDVDGVECDDSWTWTEVFGLVLQIVEVVAVILLAGAALTLSSQLQSSQDKIVKAIEGLKHEVVANGVGNK